jgi:hypothetical protein
LRIFSGLFYNFRPRKAQIASRPRADPASRATIDGMAQMLDRIRRYDGGPP